MKRILSTAAFAALAFLAPLSPVAAQEDAPPMPVRGASLTLKVGDFAQARARLLDAAAQTGAQIVGGQTVVSEKGRKHGTVVLYLPAESLPKLLPAIRGIGVLASDNITSGDSASEYETIGARIGELHKHQARLQTLLQGGRNLRGSDVLYLQERLFRSGADEADLQQHRRDLLRRSRRAQVSVMLFEPLPVAAPRTPLQNAKQSWANGYANAVRRAEFHRGELMTRLATAFAFAVVYAPLWLPVYALAAFLLWRFRGTVVRGARAGRGIAALLREKIVATIATKRA